MLSLIQRVPRYRLLLASLLDEVDVQDPEHANLQRMLPILASWYWLHSTSLHTHLVTTSSITGQAS
jgi:hypothetical protein